MNENVKVNEVPTEYTGSAEKLAMVREKLDALKAGEVRWFHFNALATVTSSIRVWQSYSADTALFATTFTPLGFDAAALSDFPLRIAAFWYTDIELAQALKPRRSLPKEVVDEAKPLHGKLASAALYLFKNDPTLAPQIALIREGSGYLDTAGDLVRYASLFKSQWESVKNRCDITESDLASAEKLGPVMLEGLTAVPAEELVAKKDLRSRAAEYLCRGADDIRDAAAYVFRKTPAALSRYPSLYSVRGPARKNKENPEVEEPSGAE